MEPGETHKTLQIFDVDCYEFRSKSNGPSEERTAIMSDEFEPDEAEQLSDGIDRSVGAVLLVHRLQHVHVLLLHDTAADVFRLPGGKLNPAEQIEDCLHRTLRTDLAPQDFHEITWRVHQYLGCWWRPHFSSKELPLVPSQAAKPQEVSAVLPTPCVSRT